MNKFKKIKTILFWAIGLLALSEITEYSFNLMNKSDDYLFYMGLLILTTTWATGVLLINNHFNQNSNNNN